MVDVILVDENDIKIGLKEKIAAHKDANLHRAFSLLIYNSKGDMLLHKRAESKYHGGGLWTNACCSHPLDGELVSDAVHRRTKEELGYTHLQLEKLFEYMYKVGFDNGLYEHEYLHVYKAFTDKEPPQLDPNEVSQTKWVSISELVVDTQNNPAIYSPWFLLTLKEMQKRNV